MFSSSVCALYPFLAFALACFESTKCRNLSPCRPLRSNVEGCAALGTKTGAVGHGLRFGADFKDPAMLRLLRENGEFASKPPCLPYQHAGKRSLSCRQGRKY